MNTTKLISFDLQGTLSDSTFSDEFWLELLPTLYAEKYNMSPQKAKKRLDAHFQKIGKYHELFYNHRLRLNELLPTWNFLEIISRLKSKPSLDQDMLDILKAIPVEIPVILFSATTRDFIDLELQDAKPHIHTIFSSIDDFNIPGKPAKLFREIANKMSVASENCLHIGDCLEMDYRNAQQAGWQSHHFNKKMTNALRLQKLTIQLNHFVTQ